MPIQRTWSLSGGRQSVACTGSRTPNHFVEVADLDAPATDQAVVYAKNSGGKTQLVARFPTGAVQQIAIEP